MQRIQFDKSKSYSWKLKNKKTVLETEENSILHNRNNDNNDDWFLIINYGDQEKIMEDMEGKNSKISLLFLPLRYALQFNLNGL
jgi:hypothetical protein